MHGSKQDDERPSSQLHSTSIDPTDNEMPPNVTVRTMGTGTAADPDDEPMEEVELSDNTLDEEEGAPANKESNNDNTSESSNGEETTDATTSRGILCCKKKSPRAATGKDLGVWESSLEDRSGILGIWLLSYLTPLLRLGSRKVLDPEDIGVPSKD